MKDYELKVFRKYPNLLKLRTVYFTGRNQLSLKSYKHYEIVDIFPPSLDNSRIYLPVIISNLGTRLYIVIGEKGECCHLTSRQQWVLSNKDFDIKSNN